MYFALCTCLLLVVGCVGHLTCGVDVLVTLGFGFGFSCCVSLVVFCLCLLTF